jgi:hypothetical protein
MASLHRTSGLRHALRGARRLAPRTTCACLCALFVVLASATFQAEQTSLRERSSAASPSRALLAEPQAPDPAPYRLGNAARPFGWSTVIGDFDTDGKPDVAVADHVAHRASGYQYRIDFSVSGEALDGLTFESVHDAVTITAADIDRDRDLDIIAVHPISGETVGVWLNDGTGHFTGVDLRRFAKVSPTGQTIRKTGPFVDLAPFDFSRQRWHVSVPVAFRGASAGSRDGFASSRGRHLRSSLAFLRTAPRAPPIPSRHGSLS